MSRQARLTLFCATVVAVLIVAVSALAGGNSLARPVPSDQLPASIDADSAGNPPTTSIDGVEGDDAGDLEDGEIALPPETTVDESGGGGFLLPEGVEDEPAVTTTAASSAETTTTTTVAATTSTTTTVPPPVIDENPAGRILLLQEGFMILGDGTGQPAVIEVGTDSTEAIAAAVSALGEPTSDTGATEDDECTGFTTRRVRFDGLEIVLSERTEGVSTFEQWFIDGPVAGGLSILTEDGLTVGMSVSTLAAINPNIVVFEEAGTGSFKMPGDTSNSPVFGRTTGDDLSDTLTAIWSGNECRRVDG